jgi:uncharacterized membrane protein YkvA (DUF1232 family)
MKIGTLWRQWARRLRLEAFTLFFAYRNPRTPWYAKLWAAIVVAYAFSPIDLIPDFVPIIGYLDDLVLIPLGIAVAARLIPKDIWKESRNFARVRTDSKKPVNWIAGSIVIAIWVALLAFVIYRVVLLRKT